MIILGLNAFHDDSSAALIRDGKLVAAAEEERFRRIKHWAGFPSCAIQYCLKEAGIELHDLDHVAVNQDRRAQMWERIRYVIRHPPPLNVIMQRLHYRARRAGIPELLAQTFPSQILRAKFHEIEHHLCHLYSAFYVSPFTDAAVVSVDGFGDFSSAAWGTGNNGIISIDRRIFFPHSIGVFYQALTQFLGFPHLGDEYKVMGLAPYGSPIYLNKMRDIVHLESHGGFTLNLDYFRHCSEIPYQWTGGSSEMTDIFTPALEELLGPRRGALEPIDDRHRNIARSAQAMYEETFFNIVEPLQKETGLTDLALAGGCAANSVANGKVRRQTGFKRVYVQSAAGDAGGAIGAAFSVWHKLGGARHFVMDHAYWGPHFSPDEFSNLIACRRAELEKEGCSVQTLSDEGRLCELTASAIAAGKVVGWFQGRMEWGPRALGNRSILCDPRRADMKAILNAKIKRRESFRPFAPSILDAAVSEWFEEDDDVPFMMQVFQIRENKRAQIPAVTHVDGSGRLQTVSKHTNPRYYRLIEAFRDITEVPMVLNTSFNENEPVVCAPQEALDCFLRTKMDVLVLGDIFIERHGV